MDVLLIQPPIQDFYLTAKRTIPYGLACIAASLRQSGFTVCIVDALATNKSRPVPLPPGMSYLREFYGRPDISPFCLFHGFRHFGYSFQHLERQVRDSGAFLVGISSLFTAYSKEAERTADLVRAALPNAIIVVGGHHPTALPTDVMKWKSVNYVIRGEGETALPLLAQAILHGHDVCGIPGIVFRKSDAGLHISEPAVMDDPDAPPRPDRRLIKNTYYMRGRRPSTVVVTSRGCPMHCSYCALGNRKLYPHRRRSVSSVLLEITEAVDAYGARFIDFEDENLSLDKRWFMSLLENITKTFNGKRLELRAMNGLFPPTLDEEVVSAMKTAGFKTLNLSLGATSPDQLKRFQRPDVRKAFENCLALAEKFFLDAVGYVICGAPGQDAGGSLEDLLYLGRRRVLAGLSVFYPAPGSRDYETANRLGILPTDSALFRSSVLPISHTTSRQESVTLMRLARIINFMKAVVDRNRPIPLPAPVAEENILSDLDRFETGIFLLKGFLHDGHIRGVMPDGSIYRHAVDTDLVRRFLSRLEDVSIAGTVSRLPYQNHPISPVTPRVLS